MPYPDDKQAFAVRLKQALKRSPKKVETATQLALQFNLRHTSDPITPQAAQKWLTGKSRPTPDKIETLARWLDVPPRWLHYGVQEMLTPEFGGRSAQKVAEAAKDVPPSEDELRLLGRLRSLPAYRRRLVEEIVEQFSIDAEMYQH